MNTDNCSKVSNNKYFNAPALMGGGRTFTDYTANVISNTYLMHQNKIKSNNAYRHFLVNNATKLMDHNISLNEKRNGTDKCDAMKIGRNTLGHKYNNDLKVFRNEEREFRSINDEDNILHTKLFTKRPSVQDQSAAPGIMCKSCKTPVPGRLYRGSLD
jgi:hypothetical protein